MKDEVFIIVNPIAGRGYSLQLFERLQRILRNRDISFAVSYNHASLKAGLSGINNNSFSAIIVIGGDGTVNHVINSLEDPTRLPLAILPAGTANMLARELRLPQTSEAFVDMLEERVIKRLDMGMAGNARFVLLLSAGFDAMVTKEIAGARDDVLGYRGYFIPILKVITKYSPPVLNVEVDGEAVRGHLALVLNVRHYGGIFNVSSSAKPDSGKFEVCVFKNGAIPDLIRYSFAALWRRLSEMPDVVFRSAYNVKIHSVDSVPVEIDGDYVGTTPVNVSLAPASIPIIVPSRSSSIQQWIELPKKILEQYLNVKIDR